VDRTTRSFDVPDSVPVVGLFGGALVLATLGLASILSATNADSRDVLVVAAVTALAVVLGCGALLLRRVRAAATSLERTRREAHESATRLKVLVEHVPAAVYIDMQDPDVSDGGRLAYMSPQITGILGYRPDELVDDPELWPSRIHPDDREAAIAAYDAHWHSGEPLRAEYRMLARDGSEVWVRDEAFAMSDDTRSGRRVSQGLLVDTTDRKRLESKLIHDALHDPLTGLANRVLLRDHLERALARQGRQPGRVALLFVDLDNFKRVNDSFGHAVGDEILCRVAERLALAVREGDVVGRQSGDEFAVLLGSVHADDEAAAAAERILAELRRPIQLGGSAIVVDGSIGIAVAARHGPGVEVDDAAKDVLVRADAAMYAAKAMGKGTFAFFDRRMPLRTWTELEAAG
jgi:diguanylate cyclase (GGDEF)-like protein/PAS domain S-box-containing protein